MTEIWAIEALYSLIGMFLSFFLGCLWGAYRYEKLWKDRPITEIYRELMNR